MAKSLTRGIDGADERFCTLSPFLKLLFVYHDEAANRTISIQNSDPNLFTAYSG